MFNLGELNKLFVHDDDGIVVGAGTTMSKKPVIGIKRGRKEKDDDQIPQTVVKKNKKESSRSKKESTVLHSESQKEKQEKKRKEAKEKEKQERKEAKQRAKEEKERMRWMTENGRKIYTVAEFDVLCRSECVNQALALWRRTAQEWKWEPPTVDKPRNRFWTGYAPEKWHIRATRTLPDSKANIDRVVGELRSIKTYDAAFYDAGWLGVWVALTPGRPRFVGILHCQRHPDVSALDGPESGVYKVLRYLNFDQGHWFDWLDATHFSSANHSKRWLELTQAEVPFNVHSLPFTSPRQPWSPTSPRNVAVAAKIFLDGMTLQRHRHSRSSSSSSSSTPPVLSSSAAVRVLLRSPLAPGISRAIGSFDPLKAICSFLIPHKLLLFDSLPPPLEPLTSVF
jgi:hypothetical protein